MAVASATRRPTTDPLGDLLRTGLDVLTQFAAAAGTGQSYVKIRMPEPAVVDRVAQALHALLESLRP